MHLLERDVSGHEESSRTNGKETIQASSIYYFAITKCYRFYGRQFSPWKGKKNMKKHVRIAFINTHPIQYLAPLYANLNGGSDLSITAIYLSDSSIRGESDRGFGHIVKWDIDLLAGYDARFVLGAERRGEPAGFFSMIAPQLWHEVRKGTFDALVLHGHTPAATMVAASAAKASHIPAFMRCETHLGLRRSALKSFLRRALIGTYYRRLDGVLAIGSANREFYRALGVPEQRIFDMPYTVDNRRFMTGARLADDERMKLRAGFGVHDDRPIALYAAKFQRRKHPDDLAMSSCCRPKTNPGASPSMRRCAPVCRSSLPPRSGACPISCMMAETGASFLPRTLGG